MSQFDYEPPTARQPRRREHKAVTRFYNWAPAVALAVLFLFLIMNWIEL